jgi:hypothetical protein
MDCHNEIVAAGASPSNTPRCILTLFSIERAINESENLVKLQMKQGTSPCAKANIMNFHEKCLPKLPSKPRQLFVIGNIAILGVMRACKNTSKMSMKYCFCVRKNVNCGSD